MAHELLDRVKHSILALDMDAALAAVNSILEGDGAVLPQQAVEAISEALEVVGTRFQHGEWFVAELVYAGEITTAAMTLLAPLLAAGTSRRLGTIVVGTVAGDMHDLGKNIFTNYARGAGFEVIDLGVDVPKDTFAGAVRTHRPLALGMSCLLTVTAGEVGKVVAELERQGTRDAVKVIIGGAALTERFAAEAGADAFAPDAVTGTDIIKTWSTA